MGCVVSLVSPELAAGTDQGIDLMKINRLQFRLERPLKCRQKARSYKNKEGLTLGLRPLFSACQEAVRTVEHSRNH